jgi:hypothetical protein
MRFRELIRSEAIRSALERGSDTLFVLALRAVEQVTSDHSQTNRQTINRLWEVLDDPHLNKALGNPPNRRKMLGPPILAEKVLSGLKPRRLCDQSSWPENSQATVVF